MAGWMFGYIADHPGRASWSPPGWSTSSVLAARAHGGSARASPPSRYAWQLFQMPYAIVGISVITALLPRMSAHAAPKATGPACGPTSRPGVRLSSVIVVPCRAGAGRARPAARRGPPRPRQHRVASARYMGVVFAVFCLGLVPYMVFQLQLRVFYALHDSRTPALIGVRDDGRNVGANYSPWPSCRRAGRGRAGARLRPGQPGRRGRRLAGAQPQARRAGRPA